MCLAGPPQVYIGHVNKPLGPAQWRWQCPGQTLVPPLPALSEAGLVGAGAVGLTDPKSPNFFKCKCYFLSREKCIYFK